MVNSIKKTGSGFTLIELLIVITIIAILAGAAIPFVQQYVEDARYSKVRQDLDEIRNALIRFETDQNRPYNDTTLGPLVGPYLSKGMSDPWGSSYVVATGSSTVFSVGPDSLPGTPDDIKQAFRPPLAITRAFWEDTNGNGVVDNTDTLVLRFTRPVNPGGGPVLADLVFSAGGPTAISAGVFSENDMVVRLGLTFGATPFNPGRDSVEVTAVNTIVDMEGTRCRPAQPVVIKGRN